MFILAFFSSGSISLSLSLSVPISFFILLVCFLFFFFLLCSIPRFILFFLLIFRLPWQLPSLSLSRFIFICHTFCATYLRSKRTKQQVLNGSTCFQRNYYFLPCCRILLSINVLPLPFRICSVKPGLVLTVFSVAWKFLEVLVFVFQKFGFRNSFELIWN